MCSALLCPFLIRKLKWINKKETDFPFDLIYLKQYFCRIYNRYLNKGGIFWKSCTFFPVIAHLSSIWAQFSFSTCTSESGAASPPPARPTPELYWWWYACYGTHSYPGENRSKVNNSNSYKMNSIFICFKSHIQR